MNKRKEKVDLWLRHEDAMAQRYGDFIRSPHE